LSHLANLAKSKRGISTEIYHKFLSPITNIAREETIDEYFPHLLANQCKHFPGFIKEVVDSFAGMLSTKREGEIKPNSPTAPTSNTTKWALMCLM
jgi:hypothetical protein